MIKFFKGDFADVSGQFGANNIVFVTDRNTINLGGVEYGKDQFKSVETSAAILEDVAAAGTIFYVEGEQALYEKTATSAELILPSVSGQVNDLKEALSATISGAFGAGDYVVVSKAGAIEKTAFTLDTTSGDLDLTAANLSTKLVNAETLKTQITTINQANATVVGSTSGIAVLTGTPGVNGTEYTVGITIDETSAAPFKFTDGKLDLNGLQIKQLTNAEAGYVASYQLQNADGHVFGDTINLVKDQFLGGAELVTGHMDGTTFVPSAGNDQSKFLKLTFNTTVDGAEAPADVYIDVNELFDSYTSGNGITVDNTTNTIAINVDTTTEKDGNNTAYLTVGSNGLKVSGINAAIAAAVQALGADAGTAGQYVTAIGVTAGGALSAATAQVSAAQVAYDGTTASLTATTVQAAIDDLAATVAGGFDSLDVANTGDTTTYIQSISETDGKISAVSATLDANAVAYTNAAAAGVSKVSGALDDVYTKIGAINTTIGDMDYGPTAAGTAPAANNETAYKFVNTVEQTDGKISATTLDLTAANTYQAGDAAVLVGTSGAVSVGVTQGSVQAAIEELANKIADFGSFHNGNGDVINS